MRLAPQKWGCTRLLSPTTSSTRCIPAPILQTHHLRFKSSAALEDPDELYRTQTAAEIHRLKHLRNVGILAHVDAGKTTVTERMLALAGVVRNAGNVDDGNTVTDYLPAERERGITIQSAAISFEWGWHNNRKGDDYTQNDNVHIQLIDTPGHVDFSVEVNRSVAVLDGAVLVVDAVAGVQAQTETVWRAVTNPSLNNHATPRRDTQDHVHEPLPCLALVNKMDKDGCHFGKAIESLKKKLPGANPIPIQLPLFQGKSPAPSSILPPDIIAMAPDDFTSSVGEFVGVVDLIHMRAILWPITNGVQNVEKCVPTVIPLLNEQRQPICDTCPVTQEALTARFELIEALAEVDPATEELYLNDKEPTNAELRAGLRRATLSHKALPVMAGTALKGKGVEPLLDAVADLLPSPLDRIPPALHRLDYDGNGTSHCENKKNAETQNKIQLGHPLHPTLLALAFKVVHMKGRGGSGDGRVVFCRVYSGKLRDRETVQVISPPAPGEAPQKPRLERIGGMLEMAGGRFNNVEGGTVLSGDVCALVGLKSVVTGDTIMLANDSSQKKKKKNQDIFCLAGVASPKPVLTVRLEAETAGDQTRLSHALKLLTTEDPSLVVEETEATTLLSGLGELHIEVTLDRLYREHGLEIKAGPPSVSYRETITDSIETAGGLFEYDRTIGGTRLQGAVHLVFTQNMCQQSVETGDTCMNLSDPIVTVGPKVREFLGVNPDLPEDELINKCPIVKALIQGCQGALKRGPLKSVAMANVTCHVVEVDAEGGLAQLKALPGAIRATAANAVTATLKANQSRCTVLEPTMSVEVTLPADMVGSVLSDLTGRRGTVGDVLVGEEGHSKSLVRGDVPLVEILGYANSLRSLTGGEGAFSAEYKGHSPCQ
jgi:elongation factor G